MKFLRIIPATALAGALSVCLMGAANLSMSAADTAFASTAMNGLTQSIANAEAVQSGGNTQLAAKIQQDLLSLGSQLASLSSYYGVNVNTDLPKPTGTASSFAQDQVTQLNKLISVMNAEKTNGNAPEMRTFADDAGKVLQKDLDAAKAAAK